MARWTGEIITMQVGPKWTYKLKLEEQAGGGPMSHLILGQGIYATEQEARSAADAHLKVEIERRSGS